MPYSTIEARHISELCTVVDCEHKTAPYVNSSEYLVVRTSNVRNGQLLFDDMKYTTREGYSEWTKRAIPEFGDVLFTREAPAGESCLVPYDKKVCMGQRMVMLRPKKEVTDPIFLSYILNTERTKSDILRLSIGSTVSRINIADIKKLKVASPPLPEQRKIATILGTWDKAISTTERLIDNSKQQKKALMQQLLTGKKRLLDDSGKPFEGEWEELYVKEFGQVITGNTPSKSDESNYGTDISWATAEDFKSKYVSDTKIKLSLSGAKLARLVPKGSVLVTCIASIGKNAIANEELATNQQINAVKVNQSHSNEFFYYLIEHNKHKLIAWAGTTAVPILNKSSFEKIKLKAPNLVEQKRIAAVLASADKAITLLEQQLADLKQEKKALMQQLLTGKRRVKVDDKEVA